MDLSNVTSDQQQSVLKLPTSVSKGVVIMDVNNGSVADTGGIEKSMMSLQSLVILKLQMRVH